VWSSVEDIADLPRILTERLQHYFSTYKIVPGEEPQLRVQQVYGLDHASRVIEAALADYRALQGMVD
jgi:inorganic pyrophosphatase